MLNYTTNGARQAVPKQIGPRHRRGPSIDHPLNAGSGYQINGHVYGGKNTLHSSCAVVVLLEEQYLASTGTFPFNFLTTINVERQAVNIGGLFQTSTLLQRPLDESRQWILLS